MFLPTRLIHGRVKVYFKNDSESSSDRINNSSSQQSKKDGFTPSSEYSTTSTTDDSDVTVDDSSGGYSSGGYSSGGYSSGGYDYEDAEAKAKEEAKELAERAAANLRGVVGYNQQTILNAAEQANKNYDISDTQNENLKNLQERQARRNAGNSWYTEQQNLQSVVRNLLDSAGNAANGSWIKDFWNIIARVDDMADAETLNTLRQNLNTVDNEYWEAIMSNNNSRNSMYADTEQNLRELASDYIAQLNNLETIDTDLLGDYVDTENHTLNLPDWLQTEYYNDNVREAIQPTEVALFRNNNAAQAASSLNGIATANLNQSANNGYWTRLRNGYSRRTQ